MATTCLSPARCNDGQLAGAVCSSALFIGTALLLRAAAALTLTGLHWVSLRTTTFVDSRILAVLQRDASAFAALSAFLALKVTAAIDGFQGAFIFQWLELPLLLVLSFLAVRTTNSVLTVIISRLNLSNPVATVQVVRIATAFCAAALVCDNVGIKISAIVTSLGVGGIIVALGSQTLLQVIRRCLALSQPLTSIQDQD